MSFTQLLKQELLAVLRNPVVLLTVFGGVVFYSFLYPLPYANQVPQQLKASVVNLDKSQSSYQLERMVDATSQIELVRRDSTIADAKQAVLNQEIGGFLVIPEDFYKDLLLGKSPTLSYAGDASYFLVYGTIVEGLAKAGGTLAAQVKVSHLLVEGVPLESAAKGYSAFSLNLKPTFNSRMGYIDYVVPAVFVLILQQTLAMASGLVGATQNAQSTFGYWSKTSPAKLMLARCCTLVGIYYLLSMYYFGASFSMYGINQLTSTTQILTLLLPFLLASCLIGIFIGELVPRRELVTVVVLISSMPLIFSSGFIWPVEMMPEWLVLLSQLFPSTPAIQGFLALNQMGASWQEVASQWTLLWGQVLLWGSLLALKLYHKSSKGTVGNSNSHRAV
ncbi:ABC transporter permease [Vibrio sp. 10N.222.51.C8]|uniref:ABC transporter permease n=1 Tax=unclassified Vibrio TaxID=2614977 RepID=UPI000C833386|nr:MULTISPECIES: ABC transporter permease [unclassified Vibrio]PMK20405.1 ABC transporter [Vibrio sp. 10N.261.54.C3]PMN95023.1 ABC transporter [Vibrio sp. 10N.222.55.C12]PMO10705.1 ABC transporter [Vibrio sp. 10N.222.54.F10]PMO21637.1 ABC transporter [Vibrio sp. 10N.222.54.B6]TKF38739.1 ABC transporter permease [Vibrio sp. F13]